MNWIRFMNRLFGARIQINEPDRVQFETNEPLIALQMLLLTFPFSASLLVRMHSTRLSSSLQDMVCMLLRSDSSCTFLEKRLTASDRSLSGSSVRTWCTRSASVLYASGLQKWTQLLWPYHSSLLGQHSIYIGFALTRFTESYSFLISIRGRGCRGLFLRSIYCGQTRFCSSCVWIC